MLWGKCLAFQYRWSLGCACHCVRVCVFVCVCQSQQGWRMMDEGPASGDSDVCTIDLSSHSSGRKRSFEEEAAVAQVNTSGPWFVRLQKCVYSICTLSVSAGEMTLGMEAWSFGVTSLLSAEDDDCLSSPAKVFSLIHLQSGTHLFNIQSNTLQSAQSFQSASPSCCLVLWRKKSLKKWFSWFSFYRTSLGFSRWPFSCALILLSKLISFNLFSIMIILLRNAYCLPWLEFA